MHGFAHDLTLVESIRAKGFAPFRLLPGLNVLVPFDASAPLDGYLLNVFACKPDRASVLQERGLASADALPDNDSIPAARTEPPCPPFAAGLAWRWTSQRPGHDLYFEGMRRYYQAHEPQRAPAIRASALGLATELLSQACERAPTPARLSSHARACWEAGARVLALHGLARCHELLEKGAEAAMDEPFLPACARFDDVPMRADPRTWLLACIIEQFERISTYSSFFDRTPEAVNRLAWLNRSPFACDETRRRESLIRGVLKKTAAHGATHA